MSRTRTITNATPCCYITSLLCTALHGMPARTSYEKGICLTVCPSVCPSVKRVDCDKTEERLVHIFIPYERSLSLSGATPSTWNFGSSWPRWSEILSQYSLVAPQQ